MKNVNQKVIGEKNTAYWQDMASILSHMKRFRKAVIKTRKEWDLPATGLPRYKRAGWYASFFRKPDADLNDSYYTSNQNELLPPSKLIRITLEKTSREFNLDSRWYFSLLFHIACDAQFIAPAGLPYPEIRLNDSRLPKEKWVVKRIWIEIYPDTAQNDINAIWNRIEEYQTMMSSHPPQKRRPIQSKIIDKYVKIRKLEDKGKSQQDIVDKNPQFNFSVAKDLSEFKKQVEKRFSPSRSRK